MRRFILLVACVFISFVSFAQAIDSIAMQQLLVVGNLQGFHIQAPEMNEKTNQEIVDLFIDNFDSRGLFVFQSDEEFLRKQVNANSSNDGYSALLTESYALFKKRLKQIDSIVTVLEAKPFVYSDKDTITFLSKTSAPFVCKDLNDLRRRIEKRLKYDCLNIIIKPTKENEDVLKLTQAELQVKQADAAKKVFLRFRRYLKNFSDDNRIKHHIGDCLSNAITLRFDPHSSYFNNYEKESWDSGLSTEEFSFGFYADENEQGAIIVSDLVPGGPAWKSNEIHEGDVILGFQFEKQAYVDLTNSEVNDFYVLFYKTSSRDVEITIRRKDNQIKKVKLQKAKLQSQENVMNSYVINVEGKKFGYIPIPAFYSDFESDGNLGCANDVAKEIVKLKLDSIQGLILDLRYNGGGSMREAIGLAGIFIDEGPMAVYKTKIGKPSLMKDLNRGTIYDGPLVVMVNGYSASASEFLTATLQDYERAVIVGSTTYGKGTAQIVLPADTNLYKARGKKYYMNPSFGYVKVTIGKFYRVTTASHQGKGIAPDIEIPDLMQRFMEKESDELFYLQNDSVSKKVVFSKLSSLPREELKNKSKNRIASNLQFSVMQHFADSLYAKRNENTILTLSVKGVKKYNDDLDLVSKKIEGFTQLDEKSTLSITNNKFMEKLLAVDEYQRKIIERSLEELKKDIILQEATLILNDLQQIKK